MKIEISSHSVDQFDADTVLVTDLNENDDPNIAGERIQRTIVRYLGRPEAERTPSLYLELRNCQRRSLRLDLDLTDVEAIVLDGSRFDELDVASNAKEKPILAIARSYLGRYAGIAGVVELGEKVSMGHRALTYPTFGVLAVDTPILRLALWGFRSRITDAKYAGRLGATVFRSKLALRQNGVLNAHF